jgi:hypothetical protein
MGLTFLLVLIGWVFFRADSIGLAFEYFAGIADTSLFSPVLPHKRLLLQNVFFILCMLIIEWIGRQNQYGFEKIGITWKPIFRWIMYYVIVFSMLSFSAGGEQAFIYFQF